MNTNDLPPAAKLAVLIEAGRAANPNVGRSVYAFARRGVKGLNGGCALCMALLGAGVSQKTIHDGCGYVLVKERLSEFSPNLLWAVEKLNFEVDSFDEIILSLREGELAKVPA